MHSTKSSPTSIAQAIDCLELDDVIAIREDVALCDPAASGAVTTTDDETLTIVDHWTRQPITRAEALAELDDRIAYLAGE